MTRNRLMLLVYFQPFSDLNWVTTLFFPEWVFCYTFNGLYGRVLINNIIQKEMDFCVVTAAVEYVEKRENIFPFSLFNPFIIWWCILLSWFPYIWIFDIFSYSTYGHSYCLAHMWILQYQYHTLIRDFYFLECLFLYFFVIIF